MLLFALTTIIKLHRLYATFTELQDIMEGPIEFTMTVKHQDGHFFEYVEYKQ